jgi:hypothetical protein
MPRVRWFIAGAAAAAGALVAAPKAYERLRSLAGADDAPQLTDAAPPPPAAPPRPRPAAAIATFDVERTSELRQKIDETRARIHEKTAVRPDQAEDDPTDDGLTEDVEPD